MTAKPYLPYTTPTTGEDQDALIDILCLAVWNTPSDRLRLANQIIKAGFRRRTVQKVTKAQLWTYFIETVLLALCVYTIGFTEHPFIYGILCALTGGSAASFGGGLVINHAVKKGYYKP